MYVYKLIYLLERRWKFHAISTEELENRGAQIPQKPRILGEILEV